MWLDKEIAPIIHERFFRLVDGGNAIEALWLAEECELPRNVIIETVMDHHSYNVEEPDNRRIDVYDVFKAYFKIEQHEEYEYLRRKGIEEGKRGDLDKV